jgi:hypothetical protein
VILNDKTGMCKIMAIGVQYRRTPLEELRHSVETMELERRKQKLTDPQELENEELRKNIEEMELTQRVHMLKNVMHEHQSNEKFGKLGKEEDYQRKKAKNKVTTKRKGKKSNCRCNK